MPRSIPTKTTLGKSMKALGLTSAQVAKRAGVGLSTVQKITQGQFPLSEDMAVKLGVALMVEPSYLLEGSPDGDVLLMGGFSLDEKFNIETAKQKISTPALWDDGTRAKMTESAQTLMDGFHAMLKLALEDGKFLQIGLESESFIRQTMRQFYPDIAAEYWPKKPKPKPSR
jgi:transcriptional regulator with XRE-family HTH domain